MNQTLPFTQKVSRAVITRGIAITLLTCTGILLARTLGVENYGKYTFVMSLIAIFSIPMQAGISTLTIKEVPNYINQQQPGYIKGFLNVLNIHFSVTLLFSLLAMHTLREYFKVFQGVDSTSWLIALLIIPISHLALKNAYILRGLKQVIICEIPEQILKPLITLVLLTTLYAGNEIVELSDALLIMLFASCIAYCASHLLSRKHTHFLRGKKGSYETTRWLKSFYPLALFSIVYALNINLPTFLLGLLSTDYATGIFRTALQVAIISSIIPGIITSTIAPYLKELSTHKKDNTLRSVLVKTSRYSTIYSCTLLILLSLNPEIIFTLVFGVDFSAASIPSLILLIGYIFNSLAGSAGITLQILDKEKDTLFATIISIALHTALALILVPNYGATGAAIAASASMILWNFLLMYQLYKHTKILINPFK